jgi:hypothetical protein
LFDAIQAAPAADLAVLEDPGEGDPVMDTDREDGGQFEE